MAEPSTDLRRQLWRHFRASGSLLRQMTKPSALIPGSFYLMHRKCGKPSCRCARGQLHATYVLTRSEAGKHKRYCVPASQRARVRKLAAAWKRSQQARAKLHKLHAQLLTLADQIVEAQQVAWPPAASPP